MPNLHFLSFKSRDRVSDDYVFRVMHLFELNEHAKYSKSMNLDAQKLLRGVNLAQIRTTSLSVDKGVRLQLWSAPCYACLFTLRMAEDEQRYHFKRGEADASDNAVFEVLDKGVSQNTGTPAHVANALLFIHKGTHIRGRGCLLVKDGSGSRESPQGEAKEEQRASIVRRRDRRGRWRGEL